MALEILSNELKYDKESIINRLQKKLTNHNIDYEKLFQILRVNNAYLSGSFLLQSIIDQNYRIYDIDIFVFNNNRDTYLESQVYELFKNIFEDDVCLYKRQFTNIRNNNNNFKTNYPQLGIDSISTLDLINNHGKFNNLLKIQIIYIDTEYYSNIKSYVNNYDIDICSNYYDGDDLYIKNLEGIINRNSEFTKNVLFTNEEIQHKFCFENNQKTINESYNDFMLSERNLERIMKYTLRNFNFKINFGNNNVYHLINTSDTNNNKTIQNEKVVLIVKRLFEDLKLINTLPSTTETILIYFSKTWDTLDLNNIDFPPLLKELRLFYVKKYIGTPKLPFGCDLYINNNKISL